MSRLTFGDLIQVPPRERNPHLVAWRERHDWPLAARVPDRRVRRAAERLGVTTVELELGTGPAIGRLRALARWLGKVRHAGAPIGRLPADMIVDDAGMYRSSEYPGRVG